jgi:hypothetical protein
MVLKVVIQEILLSYYDDKVLALLAQGLKREPLKYALVELLSIRSLNVDCQLAQTVPCTLACNLNRA